VQFGEVFVKTHLYKAMLGLALCLVPFGLSGATRAVTANTLTGADRDFIVKAEKTDIQQRVLGLMAQEKSQNSDIKSYGKMLVKDDNADLEKLVDLMMKDGMGQPKTLPEERNDAVKKMQGLSGAAFDREFLNLMVQDHKKAIAAFKDAVDTSSNAGVRDYAKNTLPMLESHLKDAQELQNKMATNEKR
jgi:putative membrane protein